jgi:hypothetical protein
MDKLIGKVVDAATDPKVQQAMQNAQNRYDTHRPRRERSFRRRHQNNVDPVVLKWIFIGVVLVFVGSYLYNFAFKSTFNAEELTQEEIDSAKRKFYFMLAFYLIWTISGLVGFIMSLVCFGRNGSVGS